MLCVVRSSLQRFELPREQPYVFCQWEDSWRSWQFARSANASGRAREVALHGNGEPLQHTRPSEGQKSLLSDFLMNAEKMGGATLMCCSLVSVTSKKSKETIM